jgi:hypothetical protein
MVLVPQPCLLFLATGGADDGVRLPTVTFQSKRHNAELGMKVGEVLADDLGCAPADLIGAMDSVLDTNEKHINVHISVLSPFTLVRSL